MSLGGSDAGDGDGDEDVEHQIEALVAQANRLEQVLRLHSTRVDAAFMVEDTARNTQRHPANSTRSRGGGADAGARRSGVKPPNARRGKTTKKKKKKRRVGRNTGATGAPTVAADRLAMQVDAGTAAADAADAAAELAAELVCLEAFGIPHGGLLLDDFGATTTSPMGGATPTTSRRRKSRRPAKAAVAKFDPAAVYGAVPAGVKAAWW